MGARSPEHSPLRGALPWPAILGRGCVLGGGGVPSPASPRSLPWRDTHLSDLLHGRGLEVHFWAAAIGPGPVLELDSFVPVDLRGAKSWVARAEAAVGWEAAARALSQAAPPRSRSPLRARGEVEHVGSSEAEQLRAGLVSLDPSRPRGRMARETVCLFLVGGMGSGAEAERAGLRAPGPCSVWGTSWGVTGEGVA